MIGCSNCSPCVGCTVDEGALGFEAVYNSQLTQHTGSGATITITNFQNQSWVQGCISYSATPPAPFLLNTVNLSNSSTLGGIGPIQNSSSPILGNISPGFSPGSMEFLDPFAASGATNFIMELAGLGGPGNASGHDEIIFSSTPNSLTNVSLDVQFIDGFVPSIGDSFTLIDGSYTGTFTDINFPGSDNSWTVHYNANDITIELISEILNLENVGVGTSEPKAALHVDGGDIFVENASSSIIMKDTDGNCRKLVIDGSGAITAIIVPCPE